MTTSRLAIAWVSLIGSVVFAQELKPLYYESYDNGKEQGVVGKAGTARGVEARGKIDLDRGTLAVFIRSDKAPAISEWGQYAGVHGMRGTGYWGMVLGFDTRLDELGFNFYDVGRYAPPLKMPTNFGRWQAGQWHHLAAVWDRFEGISLYEDGKKVASNWGKDRREFNTIPENLFASGVADEMYVFSECLTDAQIAELAAGRKPAGPAIAIASPDTRREHELARMGWSGASLDVMPKVESGKGVALSFARIAGIIDAKRPQAELFEGFADTTWPNDMYFSYMSGKRADVTLAPHSGFDRVRVLVQRAYGGNVVTEKATFPIITDRAAIVHGKLPAVANDQKIAIQREHGRLGQFDVYRADPIDGGAKGNVSYSLAKAETLPDTETGLTLRGETPARYWSPVLATQAVAAAWTLQAPAFGGFQAVTDAPTDAKAFDGAVITLVAEGITQPTPVRIGIKEPVYGRRDWLIADVVLEPKGAGKQSWTVKVTGRPVINLPPLKVQTDPKNPAITEEPGVGFGINLVAANPVTWHMGAGGTTVSFTTTDMAKALPAATDDQVEFMRESYAQVMEGHAYGVPRLVIPMKWLAKFAPDRMELRQMYERAGSPKFGVDINVPKLVMPEKKNDTGAPDWAFWQMQAMNEHRRVLHTIIDNQQVESGEYGGVWNDDTDHVENWPDHILCMDDSGKIADSYRKLCEGLWNIQLDQGVGKYVQDVCHFYEEGMGVLAMQAIFDVGDPTVMSRLLTVNSHYDRWLAPNKEGGYDYRSEYISINGAWTMRDFGVNVGRGGHKLDQMVSAGYLLWYNRHPVMAKYYAGLKVEGDGGFHNSAYQISTDYDAARKRHAEALSKPLDPRNRKEYIYYMDELGLTDEQRKLHAVEFKEPGPIAHYWGAHQTDEHYYNWRMTGDTRWLTESYKRVCEWFYSHDWLNSDARPSMDRNPLPRYSLVRARLGSLASNRGASGLMWPMHGISWTKGADAVAALVTENVETKLSARFYPFTDAQHEMQLRVWRLQPGKYTVTLAHDTNDDGKAEGTIWTKEMKLDRGASVDVTLPPKQCSILTFTAIESKPFNYDRGDVAIGPRTCDLVYGEHLVVKVYNLGTKPAENVYVRVTDARSGLPVFAGEQRIPKIDAPLDMAPKYVGVEFKNINANSYNHLIIEVDPNREIDDLNPYNNRVDLRY